MFSLIDAIWTHFATIFRIRKPAGPGGPPGVKHFDVLSTAGMVTPFRPITQPGPRNYIQLLPSLLELSNLLSKPSWNSSPL